VTASPVPPGRTATVLVVDDDAAVRRIAATALRTEGFTVLEAADGPSGVAAAGKYGVPVDLLVTDFVMPGGMNGRDLARALAPRFPAMRVLYISGHAEEEAVQRNLLEGAFKEGAQFLQKPFTGETLARKARAVLRGV
jgi:two-component system cell cycle sensor histidine kinase/response regulator CckA